jgi:hypothetical protein
MIQIKRGKTINWLKNTEPLADGQPCFDKTNGKLKVGNGTKKWSELPYASGIFRDEVLASEAAAKIKQTALKAIYGPILSNIVGANETPIITYGTEAPSSDTVGEVYLQHYESEPEVDYVVESGRGSDGIWSFQRYKSGFARCWASFTIESSISTAVDGTGLYHNDSEIEQKTYPIVFASPPTETASVQCTDQLSWLVCEAANSKTKTAKYKVLSTDSSSLQKNLKISIEVHGSVER